MVAVRSLAADHVKCPAKDEEFRKKCVALGGVTQLQIG